MSRRYSLLGVALYIALMGHFLARAQSSPEVTESDVFREERPDRRSAMIESYHGGPTRAISLSYPILYLGGGEENDIKALDVDNPTSPVLVSRLPMEGVTDLEARGNYLYVCRDGNLAVVDYSSPETPSISMEDGPNMDIARRAGYRSITMAGDYLCVMSRVSVHLFDLSNPRVPSLISEFRLRGRVGWFAAGDGFICTGDGYHNGPYCGIWTWDDPKKPSFFDDDGRNSGLPICSWNDRLLLSDGRSHHSERLMDMSDPANPQLVAELKPDPGGRAIKCGNTLFLLHTSSLFCAIDLSDEMAPEYLTPAHTDGTYGYPPSDLASHGNILYVEHPELGLCFYDVAEPTAPILMYESRPKHRRYLERMLEYRQHYE